MKRKSMILGVLLMIVSLVISGCTGRKPSGQTNEKKDNSGSLVITNREKLYQFQRPSSAWDQRGGDKFNDYRFVTTMSGWTISSIHIGSRTYTTEPEELDLSAAQHPWIQGMQKKYKWRKVKIIKEEVDATLDGRPAVWTIIEYQRRYRGRRRIEKEKIYLVKGDKFYYRLRLGCPKVYFDRVLEEFEELVKSFKILGETPGEPKDKKALGITKRSPIKPGEETFERPRWRKGYRWTYRYRFSGEPYLGASRKVVEIGK